MAKDWSGYKYRIFKSLGLNVDMIFAYQADEKSAMQFHLMSHEFNDGVGAIRQLCEDYDFALPQPAIRKTRPEPSLLTKLKLLKKHLANAPAIHYAWKKYDEQLEGLSPSLEYALFDLSSSEAIRQYCKKNHIGETALFLSALDKAACGQLLSKTDQRSWLLPHDFRRAIGQQRNNSNVTAPLNLLLNGPQDAGSIFKQIKSLYRQDILWGAWLYTNFSAYLPRVVIAYLFKRMHKPGWLGVFANMGRWKSTNDEDISGHWISAPPAAIVSPLTAGAFTWNDRTAFSLQCHASLKLGPEDISVLMQQWLTVLSAELGFDINVHQHSITMAELIKTADRRDTTQQNA
ncbi:MAG: hypothetical protein HRU20_20570 [Pseudomonadales bacterium]|nr:hypothetical protein [Pseudomonadales bacterium]